MMPMKCIETVKPFLEAVYASGVKTFVDCTPMYLGRDDPRFSENYPN